MAYLAANAPGYLVRPVGDGPFPGMVGIQEWRGLDDHIARRCSSAA